MQISIHVKTRAKRPGVVHLVGSAYEVSVAAAPVKGAANMAVIDMLARYFGLKKSQITIRSGLTTSNKIIEIDEES